VSSLLHARAVSRAQFRFYEELNDFLPPALRKREFSYAFHGTPAIKDAIEALGVPHTEVDLILIDGESVDFHRRLRGGERVAVYPMFERFDIGSVSRLRPRPLRQTRFVLDVHLGTLARYLRMLGFDALYRNDYHDQDIIAHSHEDRRVILTRDKGLLKHGAVTHGYWMRETEPLRQLREVVRAFDLAGRCRPFTRCIACNGVVEPVDKSTVMDRLPERVRERFERFTRCQSCGRVYWPGSHYDRMRDIVRAICTAALPS